MRQKLKLAGSNPLVIDPAVRTLYDTFGHPYLAQQLGSAPKLDAKQVPAGASRRRPGGISTHKVQSHRVFDARPVRARPLLVAASFSLTRALTNALIFAIGSGLPNGKRKVDRSARYCSSPLASPAG